MLTAGLKSPRGEEQGGMGNTRRADIPQGLAVLASPREQGMNKAAIVKLGFQLPSFGRSGMGIPDTTDIRK